MIQSLSLEFHHGINGERFSIPKSGAAGGAGEPCAGATKQLGGGLGSMARFRNNGEFYHEISRFFFHGLLQLMGEMIAIFGWIMGHFTTPNSIWGVGSPAFHGPTWVLS